MGTVWVRSHSGTRSHSDWKNSMLKAASSSTISRLSVVSDKLLPESPDHSEPFAQKTTPQARWLDTALFIF
ncbi:hypothetical protein [Coleofasciculus sp. E2-BRE-01]|uniref:hypothetical protein n=1 Tax=Coleofasciculus sp. E2-BRE-01 TaxID=3069524 RepID=UPI0032F5C0D7